MYDTRTFASGALHAPIWSSAILLCTKALVCTGSYLRATWRDQARKPANGASINKNPTVAITPAASRCSLPSPPPRPLWERRLVGIVEHSREIHDRGAQVHRRSRVDAKGAARRRGYGARLARGGREASIASLPAWYPLSPGNGMRKRRSAQGLGSLLI